LHPVEGGATTFDARLVAHADGFWYVLNENAGTLGKLEAIPDDSLDRMRIPPD
jgi:hypothetical protein